MLRAIMAVSADNYVCRGPNDDMKWTGKADKQLFRNQTMGCVLGAGTTTFKQMPSLPGRRLIQLSRGKEQPCLFDVKNDDAMTLGEFALAFPDAWLIGGQTVLLSAIRKGLVDRVLLSYVRTELGEGEKNQVSQLCSTLGWKGSIFPQDELLSLVTWAKV